jgi:hypothetical protein
MNPNINKTNMTFNNEELNDYQHVLQRAQLCERSFKSAEYLYLRLGVIDSKVSGLLTFNSIFIATIAFATASDADKQMTWLNIESMGNYPILLSVVSWLISTSLCLWISRLKWESTLTPESGCVKYLENIIKVTCRRTKRFNFALYSIEVALALLFLPILKNLLVSIV